MANANAVDVTSEIVETLSLTELCRTCGSSADWVIELVNEGVLEPQDQRAAQWRFESTSITIALKVQRLQTDLRLNIPAVALVLSLVEENAQLKRQLQLLEHGSRYAIRMSGPE